MQLRGVIDSHTLQVQAWHLRMSKSLNLIPWMTHPSLHFLLEFHGLQSAALMVLLLVQAWVVVYFQACVCATPLPTRFWQQHP